MLSEESGPTGLDRPVVVVIDPVDGSTNAARGIPWYATSLCAVDADGPRAARGGQPGVGGAVRSGPGRRGPQGRRLPIRAVRVRASWTRPSWGSRGYPPRYFGWPQYRCLGAAALDLCAVAEGVLDGYAVVGGSQLGSWDYLGGMLVCTEAGAVVGESQGRDLVTLVTRRAPDPVGGRHAGPAGGVPVDAAAQ